MVKISHEFNKGYGASLKSGMAKATGEYIAWFDADNEHKASDLQRMFEIVQNQNYVAVIGSRQKSTSGLRRFGKSMIRALARVMGTKLGSDINCGLRIVQKMQQ